MRKLLFITNGSIGTEDATGQMLNNIFGSYHDVEILQYSISDIEVDQLQIMPEVTHIKHNDFTLWSRLMFHFYKQTGSRTLKKTGSFFRILNELSTPSVSKKTFDDIEIFKPDIIYTLGANIQLLRIGVSLSKKFQIPIIVHNMDDFYNMKYDGRGGFWKYVQNRLQKEYRSAYERSFKSLGIGPAMAEEYERTFRIPFDWVMNCSDNHTMINGCAMTNEPLLIFSGGLHGGRSESLVKIAETLENSNYKLEIFTSNTDLVKYHNSFNCFANTKLLPYVKKEDMFSNLRRASFLLHVESFEEKYRRYFRLSMSTKIPEYMSLGKPIICVGPQDIATVAFIENNKIGIVVNKAEDLVRKLSEICTEDISNISTNVNQVFYKYFQKEIMHKKLLDVIDFNIKHSKALK